METIDYTLFGMNRKEYDEKTTIVKNAMVIICDIFDCIDIIRDKEVYVWCGNRIVEALTEQDRTSRAEEREECVRAAQDWYRNMRNEPKDSQWYYEVENDCVDLRNFIDHKRGSCDSYVTDTLCEEIDKERKRCIKEAQDAHCKLCKYYDGIGNICTSFYECNEREMIRKAMEGGNNG